MEKLFVLKQIMSKKEMVLFIFPINKNHLLEKTYVFIRVINNIHQKEKLKMVSMMANGLSGIKMVR